MNVEIQKNLKHNLVVNLLDGGFFGFALGFASFVTVIPLFVSELTSSAILIGLIPAIHSMGWQLPQILTAHRVSQQTRYKPMVMWMTIHERIPFLGLTLVAFFLPSLTAGLALGLIFFFLVWQGLGGGFTATAWQSMIGKIIPSDRRGTFYGAQSAAANLLASLGAVAAGFLLEKLDSPLNFGFCFLIASVMLAVSWAFMALTREPESAPANASGDQRQFWSNLGAILKRDGNFRWFLAARMLSQFAVMAFAFYTVYAVRHHGMSKVGVGVMTSVFLGAQIVLNPLMGWIGDRWSHRALMEIGVTAAAASGLLAWWAPGPGWFYLVFILAGVANVAIWTISMAMILNFGSEADRPAYIGLANSLIAPVTILAPFIGGWLADSLSYPAAFLASAAGGLAALSILHFRVNDPRRAAAPVDYVEPAGVD